jgi:hypothetical protein
MRMLSTQVDAGAFESIMIFSGVETAARVGDDGEKSLTYNAYGAASGALHGDGILSPWYRR